MHVPKKSKPFKKLKYIGALLSICATLLLLSNYFILNIYNKNNDVNENNDSPVAQMSDRKQQREKDISFQNNLATATDIIKPKHGDLKSADVVSVGVEQFTKNKIPKERRMLQFEDLEIGKYIDHGVVNVVCHVKLPDWWYERQHRRNTNTGKAGKKQKYVIKMAAGGNNGDYHRYRLAQGNKEARVFETLYGQNKTLGDQHNIVPYVFLRKNMINPYYSGNQTMTIPYKQSMPEECQQRLLQGQKMIVIVVPYLDDLVPYEDLDNIPELRIYMRSLLRTLDYAHSLGITNNDLSNTNVEMKQDTLEAVIMDWNGWIRNGEEQYDSTANMWLTAPEGMIPIPNDYGVEIKQTRVWGMDIWATGIMFAYLAFAPCEWINPPIVRMKLKHEERQDSKGSRGDTVGLQKTRPVNYHLLRENMLHLGGNTLMPTGAQSKGEEEFFDMAPLAGLNRSQVLDVSFRMPLYDIRDGTIQPCNIRACKRIRKSNVTKQELDDIVSFVQAAMILSPAERPTAAKLLQHPFFVNY